MRGQTLHFARMKKRLSLAQAVLIAAAAAFVAGVVYWIWDTQTRVAPISPALQNQLAKARVGRFVVKDAPLRAVIDELNHHLEQHTGPDPLRIIMWEKQQPPRGFRRLKAASKFPDPIPGLEPIPPVRHYSPLSNGKMSYEVDETDLADLLMAVGQLGNCTMGRRGNFIVCFPARGTFTPPETCMIALTPEILTDLGEKPDEALEWFCRYEGDSAALVAPDKVRIRAAPDEVAYFEMFARTRREPSFVERLKERWTGLRKK